MNSWNILYLDSFQTDFINPSTSILFFHLTSNHSNRTVFWNFTCLKLLLLIFLRNQYYQEQDSDDSSIYKLRCLSRITEGDRMLKSLQGGLFCIKKIILLIIKIKNLYALSYFVLQILFSVNYIACHKNTDFSTYIRYCFEFLNLKMFFFWIKTKFFYF